MLEGIETEINIAKRNINHLRNTYETTLMAGSKERNNFFAEADGNL